MSRTWWMVSILLLAGVAGCDANGTSGQDCDEAEPAVVKEIMAGARTDFRPVLPDGRDGVLVDHVELRGSSTGRLPQDDRTFGADRLVAVSITTFLGGEDTSDGFASVEAMTLFVLDADGALLGPADPFTASLFDLATPGDPGWLEWGDGLVDSPLANDLFHCVDPD